MQKSIICTYKSKSNILFLVGKKIMDVDFLGEKMLTN